MKSTFYLLGLIFGALFAGGILVGHANNWVSGGPVMDTMLSGLGAIVLLAYSLDKD